MLLLALKSRCSVTNDDISSKLCTRSRCKYLEMLVSCFTFFFCCQTQCFQFTAKNKGICHNVPVLLEGKCVMELISILMINLTKLVWRNRSCLEGFCFYCYSLISLIGASKFFNPVNGIFHTLWMLKHSTLHVRSHPSIHASSIPSYSCTQGHRGLLCKLLTEGSPGRGIKPTNFYNSHRTLKDEWLSEPTSFYLHWSQKVGHVSQFWNKIWIG